MISSDVCSNMKQDSAENPDYAKVSGALSLVMVLGNWVSKALAVIVGKVGAGSATKVAHFATLIPAYALMTCNARFGSSKGVPIS